MRMFWKSCPRDDAILIDDPQRAETHVIGINIVAEAKSVMGIKPPMLSATAIIGGANGEDG